MSVPRLLAVVHRAGRRVAPTRRYGLGSRVLAAREPKVLRAATRLAAARTRMAWSPTPVTAAPLPPASPSGPLAPSPQAPSPPAAPVPLGALEITPKYSESSPTRDLPTPVSPRLGVARAPRSAGSAPPAAFTPESLGLGPASFEWLFGDRDKALAHPDVTPGPVTTLPPMSPQERSARRVARLTARGGSPYGRGAQISEGTPAAPDPAAGAEVARSGQTRLQRASRDAEPAAPPRSEPSTRDRLSSAPSTPRDADAKPAADAMPAADARPTPRTRPTPPPRPAPTAPTPQPAPTGSATQPAPAAPAAQPRRRRLVSRRPAIAPVPRLARAVDEPARPPAAAPLRPPVAPRAPAAVAAPPTAAARPAAVAPPAAAAPPAASAPAAAVAPPAAAAASAAVFTTAAAVRSAPVAVHAPASPRQAPPTRPPVRRAVATPVSAPARLPGSRPLASPTPRPTVRRARRPALAPAAAKAAPPARPRSLLRRALAALTPRPQPEPRTDFAVPGNTHVQSAPTSSAPPAPITLGPKTARPKPAQLRRKEPAGISPAPPLWAPAERSAPTRQRAPTEHSPPTDLRAPDEGSGSTLLRAPAGPPSGRHLDEPDDAPAPPTVPSRPPTILSRTPTAVSRPPSVLSRPPHREASAAAPGIGAQPAEPPARSPGADPLSDAHADAAYRDLLLRVREEREQLGQLISHPF